MDLFVIASTVAGMPLGLLSTWIIDKIGLRWTILTSSALAFAGALVKCLVTFPGLEENIDSDVRYWVSIPAQFLVGAANPLCFSLPNKASKADLKKGPWHEEPREIRGPNLKYLF